MIPDQPEEVELASEKGPSGAESSEDSAAVSAAPSAPEAQVEKLKADIEDLKKSMVRRQADFENFRKRMERERADDGARAVALLAEALLPVLDAFERALDAHADPAYEEYRKGFELIDRQLLDALGRYGLQPIEAEGKRFDPHVHEAVERVESAEVADGTVVAELRRGYRLRDRVLRPAMVRVAVKPAKLGREAD